VAGVSLAAMLTIASAACRRAETPRPASARAQIAIGIPSPDAPVGPLVFSLTRTRLLRLDQEGHEQPALIERWAVSPDHLTWTLGIREGAHFQDGREVTAADVAALLNEAVASRDSGPGLWSVRSVDVAGPREVRVTLREPGSLLLESLSLVSALPTGPYREPQPDDRIPSLEAVAHPSEAPPEIQTVALRRYDTPRAAVAALLREEVDVLYEVPNESRALLAAQHGVQVYPHVKPYVVTLGLNHRHPVLSRRRVRLAMNALVDRAPLVEEAGGGEPAADLIWLQHWSRPHTADGEALRVDRDRARTLLDAEGLLMARSEDGTVQPRFRVKCLVLDDPTMARIAGRLHQMYADAGIVLDLESVPLPQLLERLSAGEFESFLSPMVSGYGLGVPYLYFGDHDRARMIDLGYTAASGAAERVRRAATDDALVSAVGDLHRVLLEDPPAVHLYWQRTSRAVGPRVQVPPDTDADVLGSLPRWKVVEEAR
jgi:ABC-type transport system substrate-binding protein